MEEPDVSNQASQEPRFDMPRVPPDVQPQHLDAAGIEFLESLYYLHGGGLAGTIGSKHAEYFAFRHGAADVLYGFEVAVAPAETPDFNDTGHRIFFVLPRGSQCCTPARVRVKRRLSQQLHFVESGRMLSSMADYLD